MINIDENRVAESLSLAIRYKTISDKTLRRDEEFTNFHSFLKERYKRVFERAEYQNFDGGLYLKVLGKSHEKPLVLMSHLDVVPENGKWSFDAFSGEIIDGVVRGRGSVDTKESLIAIFEAIENLLENGFELNRDLYILSSSREEIAGQDIPDMVEKMKQDGVQPLLVVDEGGGIIDPPVPGVSGKFAMIGMVERSSARIVVESHSKKKKTAAENMADFILSVKKLKLGKRDITPETRAMFMSLLPNMNGGMKLIFAHLDIFKPILLWVLPKVNSSAKQIIGPTLSVTSPTDEENKGCALTSKRDVLRVSGNYYNKIDDLIDEVSAYAEKKGLKATVSVKRETPRPEPLDGAGYKFIKGVINDVFKDIGVSPYCILGGTDARHFVGYADFVIRFAPIYMNKQQFSSFHGIDENINISSVVKGVYFYQEVVKRVNTTGFTLI